MGSYSVVNTRNEKAMGLNLQHMKPTLGSCGRARVLSTALICATAPNGREVVRPGKSIVDYRAEDSHYSKRREENEAI